MMTQHSTHDEKYKAHLQAHDDFQHLMEISGSDSTRIKQDKIKYSLDQLSVTLATYFKVSGIA